MAVPRWAAAALALAAAFGGLQARVQPAAAAHVPFSSPLPIPPVLTDQDLTITMQQADVQILPGAKTKMWTYNGMFPGPTIRRPSGQPTRVTFVNNLPAEAGDATVHHHGSHSASSEDGQPDDYLIEQTKSRTYTYDFVEDGKPERAAFQWYHDHRMDVTGRNVWKGLAGMVILDDPQDTALDLPSGEFDVPIMLADRQFDAGNQIPYTFDPNGLRASGVGGHVLANGAAQPFFDVGDRRYRIRLLNASNLSDYELELGGGMAMTQIATESGLLPKPVQRTKLRLGPAERAEIVVDFDGLLRRELVLRNRLGFGPAAELMKFRVSRDLSDDSTPVPATLRLLDPAPVPTPIDTRLWVLGQSLAGDLIWTINGRTFDPMRDDTIPFNPRRGSAERWIFVNTTPVDHLMHIHDVDWWLTGRLSLEPYDADDALAEQGLKETFRVRPNEVVEVVSRFTDHLGPYVFHCHILEHEDRAMMAQFRVVP